MKSEILTQDFFLQDTKTVALKLLGKRLVREINGQRISGIISETEAYLSSGDTACHAYKGKTKRNAPMFETGGIAYVYFIYGMYYMLNFVTEEKEKPAAVLIRSLIDLENIKLIEKFYKPKTKIDLNGPGKLSKALNVDKDLNYHKLFTKEKIWVEDAKDIPLTKIEKNKRIGINYAEKKDIEALLRFTM